MSETKLRVPERPKPEDSPIAWFSELLIAIDHGEYPRASEAQRQLARLGWDVNRRRSRRKKGGAL